MNAQQKIEKLEALLARVQSNAAKPRIIVAAATISESTDSFDDIPTSDGLRDSDAAPGSSVSIAVDALVDDGEFDVSETDFEEVDAASGELDIGGAEEEDAPISSERAIPGSLEDALGAARDDDADELDIVTPPPESGRMALTPAPTALAGGSGPTMEQLGETVDLGDSGSDDDLELEVSSEVSAVAPEDDLELDLPDASSLVGNYDESLAPPPSAAQDLARLDARNSGRAQAAPAVAKTAGSGAEAVHRHATVGGSPAAFSGSSPSFAVASFAELIDRSMALGK